MQAIYSSDDFQDQKSPSNKNETKSRILSQLKQLYAILLYTLGAYELLKAAKEYETQFHDYLHCVTIFEFN